MSSTTPSPETALRLRENAGLIAERHRLPPEVAKRIVEMAKSIDQAHAIAELMR